MRSATQFLLFITINMVILALLPIHALYEQQVSERKENLVSQQLKDLHVTDLCLVTEARYTRHPALADRHAPFQEHPLAFEYFPSGSLILPPMPSDKP